MAKDPYRFFRIEARDLLRQMSEAVLAAEQAPAPDLPPRLLRLAHTLKGAASVVRQPGIAAQAHAIEDLLTPLRDRAEAPGRTDLDALLALIDAAGDAITALDAPAAAGAPTPPRAASTGTGTGSGSAAATYERVPDPSAEAGASAVDAGLTGLAGLPGDAGAADPADAADPDPIGAMLTIPQLMPEELDGLLADIARTQGHLAPIERAAALLRELRAGLQGQQEALAGPLARLEDQIERGARQLARELVALRDGAEQLRLLPAAQLFAPLQRTARDAARSQDKQARLTGHGGDVKLEAALLNAVSGALVQMVRNAVAHGIEPPAERIAAGKPPQGRIELRIERRGREVLFCCADDGAGLDLEAVRRTAIDKGIPGAARLDDAALIERLLRGGLSTARRVDALAGRGVGMDLVRDTADRLGGRLTLSSRRGEGTTVELCVPLQLAALRAIRVSAGTVAAWVPLDAVECVLQRPVLNGAHLIVGDELLPHLPLADALQPGQATAAAPRSALVLRAGGQRAALGVDALDGVTSVVLRPPPALLPPSPLIAGLALDAAQQPVPVLAAEGLIAAARQARPRPVPAPPRTGTILVIDDSLTTRMLEQSILEAAGYRVHMAASAEDGLEAAQRERYALILVDVEMPGMDGFEFVARIRGDAALRHIPAVLVTSRNAPEDLARGKAVGADGYIVKGEFAQNEFLAQVAQLMARSAGTVDDDAAVEEPAA
ncbi:two-component system chemotaxis sensor kinase CheA [Mitsuaria sp. BK045]|uniref:hybrid sensor histidine kinase/response regulator n=1 Tax=unclassified Roseateles TaxID=2626991 RepID=UPI001614AD58|nr:MULTISPECIES: response regulator [unclassified Roseateles]MBB3294776.1 two-component system chemotaxis sensor kinase CheA [Mitsuaria sp. BK041]MBB3363992.1 two-component system chemotaxis sensor kinase CheA [Mitsuaria sp. BK045]